MNILKIENLSLQYGNQKVLNHISFNIRKGQIVGLLGPNGAGKSSIIKILAGLVFPNTGKICFDKNMDISFSELRKHSGYLIDTPAFYPFLTAKQNLHLLKKINKIDTNIDQLLQKVGLTDVNNKKVKHFSTGMKQRLAIAQSMMRNPEILILDEPFNGLDPNGFQELIHLLKKLNKNGTTIIVSSHLLNELEQFANTFILLYKGNIALNIDKVELVKSKKKVAFTFETKPTNDVMDYLNKMEVEFENPTKVIMNIDPSEIANTVNHLVELMCTPINVETLNILQEKYLDITV